tara:strand:- start:9298 stop:10224 length:927 start_codon:yes stop_codon:yes gene_type:complete
MKNNSNPLVSVCMITYNHENYIKQAIEGVLMQECNFNIELIIANDKSTDRTDEEIVNLINTHSRSIRITYFSHKNNLGMIPNFIFSLNKCKGKYIAMCEGDDFWTDPYKLQKQFDFLESNDDYVLSFHDAMENNNKNIVYNNKGNDLCSEDLILNSHLHTSTAFFRWNKEISKKTKGITVTNGDTALYSILGHFGKGKYIKDITPSIYRIHDGGVWSGKTLDFKLSSAIETYKWILNNSDIKYKNALREKILKKSVSLAVVQNSSKNWKSLIKNLSAIFGLSFKTGKFRYLLYLIKLQTTGANITRVP